jgi:hypothetical protein
MQHVIQSALEQVLDVVVVQGIEDLPPGLARPHQAHLAQAAGDARWRSEMPTRTASSETLLSLHQAVSMRTGWLAQREQVGQVAGGAASSGGRFRMMLSISEQMFRYSVIIVGGAGPRVKAECRRSA